MSRARHALGVLLASALAAACAGEVPESESSTAVERFWRGANFPWHGYGHDVGEAWGHDGVSTDATNAAVRAQLGELEAVSATVVRWFLFGDGRAIDAGTGLTDAAVLDLDALLLALDDHELDVIPVLFDFLWLDGREIVDGVELFGRAADVRDPSALIANVVEPLARRYGGHPRVRAWEVINEPEWAMSGHRVLTDDVVEPAEMQAFVARVAAALREHSDKPVTVGSASLDDMMSYWSGSDLELLSFHDYSREPLTTSKEALGVDVPVLLSELPSVDADVAGDIERARRLGYQGALPWSLGVDEQSDAAAVLEALGATD